MARAEGLVKMVTLAPEIEGGSKLLEMLARSDTVAAMGHTQAGEAQIDAAIQGGMTHATHLFNAMTPLHHREPGPAGIALTDERLSCDLI